MMRRLQVRYHAAPDRTVPVGEVAEDRGQFFFSFDESFIAHGFPLSPFKLPVAPGFDLTYADGPGGEHTTTLVGDGRAPGLAQFRRVAEAAGIGATDAVQIVAQVQEAVDQWPVFARASGVRPSTWKRIAKCGTAKL